MSDPRHRLEPAPSASDLASYPPPPVVSRDFDAVTPLAKATQATQATQATMPALYIPPRATHTPSGDGPDQWAEDPTPESDVSDTFAESSESERSDGPDGSDGSDDLALAHS
jgi:hypothetical protein